MVCSGDKDRGVSGEKRTHYHNKSLFICTQAQAIPTPPPPPPNKKKTSLWSAVTPIKPAKPSLSVQAADLRTPRQQIGRVKGYSQTKEAPSPFSSI
ncbi:hypothetical protein PBY51_002476 [Eleginops maclovinus]|uniref:Uncharacterized protein n=1 Tax=Eleginops maclovinus TaxID=56733 RepID=A0AAN8AFU4_ELEMC|nr:hypothetical protein PBY51_002476 [Eleginops maclovinus]